METQKRQMRPYVRIVEEPKRKTIKFLGKDDAASSVNCIEGANSTGTKKTYPTIEIIGYKGEAIVVVSCVTENRPHQPHPNSLIGNKACKKGVCTLKVNTDTMRAAFSDLRIQCDNDIEGALKMRESIRVDPYKTGFSHRLQPHNINANAVRLCFQVIIEGSKKGCFTRALEPVVTEPLHNLIICRLANYTSSVMGNSEVTLLCGKVAKDDIAVRFYEEQNDQIVWEATAKIDETDVHNETAIVLKTPTYHTLNITKPVRVYIQLKQPSDGSTSAPLPFQYVPLSMETKYLINQEDPHHHCYNHFIPRHPRAPIYSAEPNNSILFTKFIDESNAKIDLLHASDLVVRPTTTLLPSLKETTTTRLNNLKMTVTISDLKKDDCQMITSQNVGMLESFERSSKAKHSNCDSTSFNRQPTKEQNQRDLVPRLLQSF